MADSNEILQQIENEVFRSFSGHKSAWGFETSGTAAAGAGYIAISGGEIDFVDPAGRKVERYYGGVGAGLSAGVFAGLSKVPALRNFQLSRLLRQIDPTDFMGSKSITTAPKSFTNYGLIFRLGGCATDDLTRDDLNGLCLYVDIGGGVGEGGSAQAMFINCNPIAFTMVAASGPIGELAFLTLLRPHALLLSCGHVRGYQAGVGVASSIGWMHNA